MKTLPKLFLKNPIFIDKFLLFIILYILFIVIFSIKIYAAPTVASVNIIHKADVIVINSPALPSPYTFDYNIDCVGGVPYSVSLSSGTTSPQLAPTGIPNNTCTVTMKDVPGYNGTYTSSATAIKGGGNIYNLYFNTTSATVGASLTKTFSPTSNLVGVSAKLTIAVKAPVNSGFTETLTPDLIIPSPSNLSTNCTGTVTSTASTITATNLNLPTGLPSGIDSCYIIVDVTSNIANTYGNGPANFSNLVNAHTNSMKNIKIEFGSVSSGSEKVSIAKIFKPSIIKPGEISNLIFTLTNNSSSNLEVNLTDNLPSQIKITNPINFVTNCLSIQGGSLLPGGSSITLSGVNVPGNGMCEINIELTSNIPGVYTNSISNIITNADNNILPATLTVLGTPKLELLKDAILSIDINGNGKADIGDTIKYIFTLKNTGSEDINNISIVDPKVIVLGGPILTLPVGATNSSTFSATYVITAADVVTGKVENLATANGTPKSGGTVLAISTDPTPISADITTTVFTVNTFSILGIDYVGNDTTPLLTGTTNLPNNTLYAVQNANGQTLCSGIINNGLWSCESTIVLVSGANNLVVISSYSGQVYKDDFTATIKNVLADTGAIYNYGFTFIGIMFIGTVLGMRLVRIRRI